MSFANSLENQILDKVFGRTDFTPPVTLYIALSKTQVLDDGTGLSEPVGNGYARVAVTNNTTNWPAAASGQKSNGTEIIFAAASGPWGTLPYFAIMDALVAGNLVGKGALASPKAPTTPDIVKFLVGDLKITQD